MSDGPTGYTSDAGNNVFPGDTGTTGTTGDTGYTGLTGATCDTGCTGCDMSLFPSASTGPIEPPHIATMDELIASFGAIVSKETADRQTVSTLLNETREMLRAPLFQWAAIGFPSIWIIQSFTIDPPQTCSDGVSRDILSYFNYCLGKDLNDVMIDIRTKMVGIALSMSFAGNTLRLHVSKE